MQREHEELAIYWIQRIRADLASFCDAGAKIDIQRDKRKIVADWVMDGERRQDVFDLHMDREFYHIRNRKRQSYRAFMAGPDMADLRHMALVTRSLLSRSNLFVNTRAKLSFPGSKTKSTSAVKLLTDLVNNEHFDLTRFITLTGDTGSGKTQILQEFTRRSAHDYLQGKSNKLAFYVNVERWLPARFTEILTTELQDLKVGFQYHAIAALARQGLLIPVIDGLDELLARTGSDDASAWLDVFLGELGGEGQLIASARSVYSEEEFRSRFSRARASEYTGKWEHVSLSVKNWTPEQRRLYLEEYFTRYAVPSPRSTDIKKKIAGISRKNSRILAKPFFWSRIVDLLHRYPSSSIRSRNLVGDLVRGYLEHEQRTRLLDRYASPLLSIEQIDFLVRELAQEMWYQETRVLDAVSVKEITENILSSKWTLTNLVQQKVAATLPKLAIFDSSKSKRNHPGVAFEHEVFFFYFLAHSIVSRIKNGKEFYHVIGRYFLTRDVAIQVAQELGQSDDMVDRSAEKTAHRKLQELLDMFRDAGRKEWTMTAQVRENSGIIVLELFLNHIKKKGKLSDLTIQSVVFPGGNFGGIVLNGCRLIDVCFRRSDLTDTQILNCQADKVYLEEPRLNREKTRLELNGLDPTRHVSGIISVRGNKAESIFAPAAVTKELLACGLRHDGITSVEQQKVPSAYVEFMERLLRAYEQSNPICLDQEMPTTRKLLQDSCWESVSRHLLRHGIVEREEMRTGGTRKTFLWRKFRPEQIMSGLDKANLVDSRIRDFWAELASTAIQS